MAMQHMLIIFNGRDKGGLGQCKKNEKKGLQPRSSGGLDRDLTGRASEQNHGWRKESEHSNGGS